MTNRRLFLRQSAIVAASAVLAKTGHAQTKNTSENRTPPIAIFAKPLQHLEFSELAKRLKSIGVQGIEATLRAGGQVEPDQFENRLGRLTEALAQHDQRVLIAASDINSASSERQLQQFARLEIPYFRMSYYRYDFDRPLLPQLDAFARQAAELAGLCRSLEITGLYQNHAGRNYVGAALWDLQQVLREVDSQHLAVAFDIRHTALELSQSWPAAYSVIRPHIGATYVKDFVWEDNKPQNVPLGQGIAKPVFEHVKRDGLVGPLSLHVEYLDHLDAALQEQRWQAVEQDVNTLREWLA